MNYNGIVALLTTRYPYDQKDYQPIFHFLIDEYTGRKNGDS